MWTSRRRRTVKKSLARLLIYREKKEYGLWAGINNNNSSTGTHIWSIHNHNKIYLTNRANPRRVVVNKIPQFIPVNIHDSILHFTRSSCGGGGGDSHIAPKLNAKPHTPLHALSLCPIVSCAILIWKICLELLIGNYVMQAWVGKPVTFQEVID